MTILDMIDEDIALLEDAVIAEDWLRQERERRSRIVEAVLHLDRPMTEEVKPVVTNTEYTW